MAAGAHGVHVSAAAPTAPRNNFTSLVGAGTHGPAPQPPAQALLTLRATPKVGIFQVENQPGLHAIMQTGNFQLMSPSQMVVQMNAAPSTAAAPTALWTGTGATGTQARHQLVTAHSPVQPRMTAQPTPNPYSVTATTTPSMQFQQSAASYNHQQQQLLTGADLRDALEAFEHISSADFLIDSKFEQISARETAGMGPLLQ